MRAFYEMAKKTLDKKKKDSEITQFDTPYAGIALSPSIYAVRGGYGDKPYSPEALTHAGEVFLAGQTGMAPMAYNDDSKKKPKTLQGLIK